MVVLFSSSCFRQGHANSGDCLTVSVRPVFLGILGTFSSLDTNLCREGHTHRFVVDYVGKLGMVWVAGEACHPTPLGCLGQNLGCSHPLPTSPTQVENFSLHEACLVMQSSIRSKAIHPKVRDLGTSALPTLVVKRRVGIRELCLSSPCYT